MGQYIGARYVPRFMGTYDATQNYEALDVVDNGSGTSYISKIPTPAGTPLTDTTHWAIYGASSGAIVNLQNQIDDMNDGSVTGSLQNQINTNASDISDLSDKVDTINLVSRNFLLIADSYGMRSTSQPTWTEILDSKLTNCRQKSYTSIGFTTVTPSPGSFLNSLTEFNSELSDDEKAEITDIVVCGGWNDAARLKSGAVSAADMAAAITNFVDYAVAHFPNARVWVGFIGWQSNDSTQLSDVNRASLITTQKIYQETIYDNLYHIANASHVMKCCKMLDITYFHPNPTGSAYLAEQIYNNIIGTADFMYEYEPSASDFTVTNGSGTFSSCRVSIVNGMAKFFIQFSGVSTGAGNTFAFTFKEDVFPSGHLRSFFVTGIDYVNQKPFAAYIENTRTITCYVGGAVTGGTFLITAEINTETDM